MKTLPTPTHSSQYSPKALATLHIAVLLFALSALYGKWIALSALFIVFGRALFAAITLAIVCQLRGKIWRFTFRAAYKKYGITGLLLALHWVSFFLAIKYSNVTLGLLTFASYPIFVCLLLAVTKQSKLCWKTWAQSLLCLLGIYLALPSVELANNILFGAGCGIFSAASFALLTSVNQQNLQATANHERPSASVLSLYQNAFAALWLLPLVIWFGIADELGNYPFSFWLEQLALIVLLGVVFTALSHTLMNTALTKLSAQLVSIAISLEPIYGIVAAIVLLGEPLTLAISIGAVLVLVANGWAMKQAKAN